MTGLKLVGEVNIGGRPQGDEKSQSFRRAA
jgi:hypothetical protein